MKLQLQLFFDNQHKEKYVCFIVISGLAFSKFAINLSIASTLAPYSYCQYSISTAFAEILLKIKIEPNIENK